MRISDHDNLYWSILDKYPEEALTQECIENHQFFDRAGHLIPYGHWRCLINHKEYYLIEYLNIEDYIIDVTWIGKDLSIRKEMLIFAVKVFDRKTNISLITSHSSEVGAKKFFENMAFFADQMCLKLFIEGKMGI